VKTPGWPLLSDTEVVATPAEGDTATVAEGTVRVTVPGEPPAPLPGELCGTVTVRVVTNDPCPRGIVTGKTETVAAGWVTVRTPDWLAGGVHAGQVSDGPIVMVKTAV
jgi:hypothetical protein